MRLAPSKVSSYSGVLLMPTDPTPPLRDFIPRYEHDDNEWWRLQTGDMQNLFDEAIDALNRFAPGWFDRLVDDAK